MNCPRCNAYNPSDARFCSQCGAPMTPAVQEAPGPGQPQGPLPTYSAVAGRLAPRDLGSLIAATFAIYRNSFSLLVRLSLVGNVPLFIAAFVPDLGLNAAISLAGLFTGLLAAAATAYAVGRYSVGRPANAATCFVAALGNAVSLMLAFLIYMAVIILSAVLSLIVIGIPLLFFILVAWFFYIQAVVIERAGPVAALSRSRQLVRGSWWRVFGIGVAFVVLLILLWFLAAMPGFAASFANATLGSLLVAAGSVLVTPIASVGATLVYFDLRARKEGLPLETLSSELG